MEYLTELEWVTKIDNLQKGQGTFIKETETVTSINDAMKERIVEGFEYFKTKYDANWDDSLTFIFRTITDYNSRIAKCEHSIAQVKYLLIECKNREIDIDSQLSGIDGFFHFLKSESMGDCVKFLIYFEGLIIIYNRYCKEHIYHFDKSYFYELIKKWEVIFKNNYGAKELKENYIIPNTEPIPETEPMPDFQYKTDAQKITWLHELGILKTVLEKSKENNGIQTTYNWSKAANILNSICTEIKPDTFRSALMAIENPNESNEPKNPITKPKNKIFVSEMLGKFKINKGE